MRIADVATGILVDSTLDLCPHAVSQLLFRRRTELITGHQSTIERPLYQNHSVSRTFQGKSLAFAGPGSVVLQGF